MTLFVASVLLALGVSAMCSLLEATLLSFTPSQVAELQSRNPRLGGHWQTFKTHIEKPIAVILLINTTAHTIGATMAGAQFERVFGADNLIWFSLIFTFMMLQFTEILPKTLGVLQNRRIAPIIALPLAFLVRILSPILYLVHLINRPFEGKRTEHKSSPLEEITALAGLARVSRYIGPYQERVIKGVAELSEKSVADVMIPLEQIAFLDSGQSLSAALDSAQHDPHTRFPVTEGNDLNRILGYANLKELVLRLQSHPDEENLEKIIRPVHFTTPDKPARGLMQVFVERREHMAIVQDEQGRTMGLVTFEDVVEELVGELEDEFDRLPHHLHPRGENAWMVGGGLPVEQLARRTGLDLPDASGSVSAWLISRNERLPRTNETIQVGNASFTIRRVRRGAIFEVDVSKA